MTCIPVYSEKHKFVVNSFHVKNQMVSADTMNDQGWKTLSYTTDGEFLLAGGDSYIGIGFVWN